ncbi:hypothetical protein [Aquabacterium sp.]|uniref:hypothetical protein n=1 Tax=Aquabacterium sp. TaxID=1872578 RepID=UPI0025BAC90B|nr:hypothetical protein [Aquabacterium sp.]
MRHSITVGLLACCLAIPPAAHATPLSPAQRDAAERASLDYAECAAFFRVVQAGFASAKRSAEAVKFKAIADKAERFAVIAAQQSRSEVRAERVIQARIDLNLSTMNKAVGPDFGQLSALMDRHAARCIQAVTQDKAPEVRWGAVAPQSRP